MASIQVRYLVGGVLFGLLFPVVSVAIDHVLRRPASLSPIALVADNPVQGVVALAPLVLGVTFWIMGRYQERLWRTANRDSLTGRPNRYALGRDLEAVARDPAGKGAHVLLADLDRFKFVNDTFGHHTGDLLLKAFSERLASMLGDDLTLYRLGGDEFLFLARGIDRAGAEGLALRITGALERPFRLAGRDVHVGTSIGIASIRAGEDIPSGVLQRADLALYDAKASETQKIRVFDPELGKRAARQLAAEADIRRGIENEEFFLEYQPITGNGATGVTGFEALARWNHPVRGRLPPSEFIRLAESSGLIVPLGETVLRMGCLRARDWPEEITLSVNVSPRQFRQGNFVDTVLGILHETGLSPGRLILEITEGLFITDIDEVARIMGALRAAGVSFALDDFGMGFSSIEHLRRLDLSHIKIDRSFVKAAGDSRGDSLLKAIIDLGHNFDLKITAEGVETMEQIRILRDYGADHFQGFYLSRPIPPGDLEAFLADGPLPRTRSVAMPCNKTIAPYLSA